MRTIMALIFSMALLLGAVQSHAETIRLLSGEWAPYCSSDPDEPGITTEIVLAAFAAAGVDTHLDFIPWPRCIKMVERGMNVAVFPYVKTPKREKFALFSVPMLTEKTHLFYARKYMSGFDFTGYEALRDYKVGTLNGFVHQELFMQNRVPASVVKDNTSALKMLLVNRLQLFPINDLVAKREIHKNFPDRADEFGHSNTPLYSVTLHLMVSKENPEAERILSLFAKGMSIIESNGKVAEILSHYQ